MRLPKKKLQNKKKIVVFSLARSDFGILKGLIFELKKKLNLSLVVSGAHHSKIFGKTISEINNEKLKFKKIYVDYEKSDTGKIFNKIIVNMYNFLRKEKFDYAIILGDRYEALATALACFFSSIKIIHIGGGSITIGSLDQIYRNCISQLSKIHFVETYLHKKQLSRLNITKNVFVTGSLSLDGLKKKKFINKILFQKKLKINFIKDKKIFITTFHPDTTISIKDNIKNLLILIDFLKQLNENIVFTYPNADYGYKKYIKIINKLKKYKNFFIIKNLGQEMFFSALNFSNLLIGNSSSGVIEAPSFKIPVMNLGNRQKNRFTSNVVINSNFNIAEMKRKFRLLNSSSHKLKIKRSLNIYENNNAVKKAAKIIYQL